MSVSGADLVTSVRELLGDTDRGKMTPASSWYTPESIIRALSNARLFTYAQLVSRYRTARTAHASSIELYLQSPRITISRLIKVTTAANGAAAGVDVPSDFYLLECGLLSGGTTYVPAVDTFIGERMKSSAMLMVYAKGGKFFGPAADAVYWAYPTEVIDESGVPLTEFPDVFYHTIKYLAAANLLEQEAAVSPRYEFFIREYARRATYLR